MATVTSADPAQSTLGQHPDFRVIMAIQPWREELAQTTPTIALCGPVEHGPNDWRNIVSNGLRSRRVAILNPTRLDWDSTWREDFSVEPFRGQVMWEFDMIQHADIRAVYFSSGTDAPITLLELGLIAGLSAQNKTGASKELGKDNTVICCDERYSKRGNVQAVCQTFGLELVETLPEFMAALVRRLEISEKGGTPSPPPTYANVAQ